MTSLLRRRPGRPTLIFMAVLLILGVTQQAYAGVFSRLFAPKADLWERWLVHAPADQRSIDHDPWTLFLSRYVFSSEDGVNRVDYAGVTPGDLRSLDSYIDNMSAIRIGTYSRAAQFSYWVNLYNALTLQVVLDHWPVKSIRDIDISPGLFADGPWKQKLIEVEGEALSLDDIEHRILRPIWRDPRIHYAVNCASIGCPNLQPEAFTPDNTEHLLSAAAREYVNHARGARSTPNGLVLSSIYEWFADDFAVEGGVIGHLKGYAEPELLQRLKDPVKIADYEYDWSLNIHPSP